MVGDADSLPREEAASQPCPKVADRPLDGVRKAAAQGEVCGDGGGEGAACAVRRAGRDARVIEIREAPPVEEEIAHAIPWCVTALDENGFWAQIRNDAGGQAAVVLVADFHPGERLGFGKVRGYEVAEGQEGPLQRVEGGGGEQSGTGLRDHHGVEDDVSGAVLPEASGHRPDPRRIEEHSDLDRSGPEVPKDGVHLLRQETGREGLNAEDSLRILSGSGREHRRAVNRVRGKREEIGLDPGAPPESEVAIETAETRWTFFGFGARLLIESIPCRGLMQKPRP